MASCTCQIEIDSTQCNCELSDERRWSNEHRWLESNRVTVAFLQSPSGRLFFLASLAVESK